MQAPTLSGSPHMTISAGIPGREVKFPIRAFVLVPLAVTAYSLALHGVYLYFIYAPFRYAGFRYESPAVSTTLIVLLATTGVALTLPLRLTRPSGIVLWVLFVVVIAPSILMTPYLGILGEPGTYALILSIGVAFSIVAIATRQKYSASKHNWSLPPLVFWSVIGVFSAAVYIYTGLAAGLSLRLVSLNDVYDVRADYADVLADSRLLGYVVSTQANVVNPVIIAAGLYSRRALPIILGVLGQFLLYSSTGFKTILFSIPAILIVGTLFRFNRRPSALRLLWGATGLLAVVSIIDSLQGGILWSSLLARRFLFTPARLTSIYLDYYSNHPFHLLGNSALAPWVTSPYQYGPPRTISLYLTGSASTSMNANLFADGFAQFGWFGIILISLVLIAFLRLLDRAGRGLPTAVAAVVMIMPSITLSNTSIITAFFSHGLLAALLVLAFAPRNVWGRRRAYREGGCETPKFGPVEAAQATEPIAGQHNATKGAVDVARPGFHPGTTGSRLPVATGRFTPRSHLRALK